MPPEQLLTDSDRDDVRLLSAVAQSRDRASFDELFERHHGAAYSLALHITGNAAAAEETVQEAMLRVWLSAKSFRGEGTVRSWLLKIVARESIKLSKTARRNSRRMDRELVGAERSTAEKIADSELAGALRKRLNDLPELDRQLVGLHFGGGLTQKEIGDALSMPQQTVSYRISESIKRLRSVLTASGFAAAAPMLDGGGLSEVLCSGVAAPIGLREKVLADLAVRGARVAARSSRAIRAVPAPSTPGWVAAAVVIAVAGGAIAYVGSRPANQPPAKVAAPIAQPPAPETKPPPMPETKPGPAVDPREGQPVSVLKWIFTQPAPPELNVIKGEWVWNEKKKAMEVKGEAWVVVPVRLRKGPAKVTAKWKFHDIAKFMYYGIDLFSFDKKVSAVSHYKTHAKLAGMAHTEESYVFGKHVVQFVDNKPARVVEYDQTQENCQLYIRITNLDVHELEIRILDPNALPKFLNDIDALRKDLEEVKDESRQQEK